MQDTKTVLVVDDEENIRKVLTAALSKEGYNVLTAPNGHLALKKLAEEPVDLMISDVVMPDMNGLDLLKKAREAHPDLPAVIITAYGAIPSAVDAMRNGALDYLTKPFDLDVLKRLVKVSFQEPKPKNAKNGRHKAKSSVQFVGESEAIKKTLAIVERAADARATVLITGESGTGKEMIAKMLHEKSARADKPFVAVSCAAIPETLLEVELFGALKGAYTGADSDRIGKFEQADGGTLFLDEIGDIPPLVQVKLLRALQERQIERLGGNKPIEVDVRFVAATNRDMEEAVKQGTFRNDLYYRLQVVQIELPPLRDRIEDVEPLALHFLAKHCAENGRCLESIETEAMRALKAHDWPGNVRELENAIERAVALADPKATVLTLELLPDSLLALR